MTFKTGLYQLNDDENYNFQLNRLINWDGGELEEVQAAAKNIHTNEDWKRELIALGDRALAQQRMENAVAYYRMSEFFMMEGDPDKLAYYEKAVELFGALHQQEFAGGQVQRFDVPFEDVTLPVMHMKAVGHKKGVILFHGGNDSYFEELFYPMHYFSEKGYEVYLFEGPGQGSVLRQQKKCFIYQWERPVKAILDYFGLEDVILVGISLGGMLAPRAAAFEKRVHQVVAWSAFPNFLQIALSGLPVFARKLFICLLKTGQKGIVNRILQGKIRKDPFMQWVFGHGMYAYGADSPFDYLRKLDDFQMLNVADQITQDVLILQGREDHFIDWQFSHPVVDSLTNARSVTLRLFTRAEAASNHCQCGNTALALNTILSWLDTVRSAAAD